MSSRRWILILVVAAAAIAQSVIQRGGPVPGAGAGVSFADAETPTGTVDGSNAVFSFAHAPRPGASLQLHRNGLVMTAGLDYTLTGNTVTFAGGATPQAGDTLTAWYRY